MEKTLLITDHAMRRFAEATKVHSEKLPSSASARLDSDGVKNVKAIIKSVLRLLMNSRRVTIPDRAFFFKLMKHGVKDHIFFQPVKHKYLMFTVIHEKKEDVLVTVVNLPRDRLKNLRETEGELYDYGALYLKEVQKIKVNYKLDKNMQKVVKKCAPQVGIYSCPIPILFDGKKRKRP